MLDGVPRVPSWNIRRAALLERLDPDLPLVVAYGPAGIGKSTLLADWARTRHGTRRPLVWVDASTSTTPDVLWWTVVTALGGAGLVDPDRVGPRDQGEPTRGDLLGVLRPLGPLTVVLEGYRLAEDVEVGRDLVATLRSCPATHLVLTSRTDPRSLREAAALTLDAVALGPADLALDADEVAAMLERAGLDHAAAEPVRRATGGVAVSVRAIVASCSHGALDLATATPEQLAQRAADGLAVTLADASLDPHLLDLARRLSVVTSLTPRLADALAGASSGDVLRTLEADGLGSWRAAPHPVFELTPVVRHALRADLERDDPGTLQALLRTVVAWGLAEQELTAALRAATDVADPDLVVTVLLAMLASGRAAYRPESIEVLAQLPPRMLSHNPYLAFFVALLHNAEQHHRDRALEWFDLTAAAIAHRLPRADPYERAVLQAGEAVVLRLLGRTARAAGAARAALGQLDVIPRGASDRVDALQAPMHRQLGVTLATAGHLGEGTAAIRRSLGYEQPGSAGAFTAHSLLAGLAAEESDLRDAVRHVEAAGAGPLPRRNLPYQHAMLDLATIVLALEDGDLEGAEKSLEDLGPELASNEFWPAFAEVQASLDLVRHHAALGEERLTAAMAPGRHAPLSDYWRARLVAARSVLALAAGQGERGLRLLRPLPSRHPAVRVARARLLLSGGRLEPALALLSSTDLPDEGPRHRAARRFLLAVSAQAAGHTSIATTALDEAVAVSRTAGTSAGWMLLAADERRSLRTLAAGAASPSVSELLDELADAPLVVPARVTVVNLSPRELVVLHQLAGARELVDIAAELQVSPNTVKTQVRGIYRKLGVHSRTDALTRARELGIF